MLHGMLRMIACHATLAFQDKKEKKDKKERKEKKDKKQKSSKDESSSLKRKRSEEPSVAG